MKKKIGASICASALILWFVGLSFAQTYNGKITRIQVTLQLENGKSRTFDVKSSVNLNNVDPGDKVRITVKGKEITVIEVTEEDDDD